ncbi:MAG: hypothetical protein IPM57_06475 [Oligoflexia bacterium]|nr:hypothetical protein [Oligoflexia bacterium]
MLFSIFLSLVALADSPIIKCTSDFSVMNNDKGKLDVVVELYQSGSSLRAVINNMEINKNVKIYDYNVTRKLDLNDPQLNMGEASLAHIITLKNDIEGKDAVKVSFDVNLAKSVKVYDLEGNLMTSPMGGTVLVEAYDVNNKLLGRIFRAIFANGCD